MSVEVAWEVNGLGLLPALTNAGWILFAPLSDSALHRLAGLARVDVERLARIQTLGAWMVPRRRLLYCFRCLVINPIDVSAPYWKRAWLDPAIEDCGQHGEPLERVPPSVLRKAGNMQRLIKSVSRYRRTAAERQRRRLC
jgi:hypothetical protein